MKGQLTADGSTGWFEVKDNNGVHVAVKGTWGSGVITIEHQVNGTTYSLLDSAGAELTYSDDFDAFLDVRKGESVRLTLADSVSPALDHQINGQQ